MVSIVADSLDALPQAAQQFISNMGNARVFAFYGNMGAGKTTFIKALCECLGVTDTVTSPTFAIVNEYEGRERVYHFDFYRIRRIEEAYDLGFEEYCYSGHLCFIEWPELIEDLLPEDAVRVNIEALADGSRRITME
ncbi:MAG: tRNA (adenosine(37)-N6)-threonylcarbamoyltransferase complex ATPase subunit type 1 TsaE [Bacteroidaceae bacterium]|nr:tRNA (adenosine(37)-N6)-threonylcarbamoyltransferase complex ATPase subunit type 1 TsaE [Bacteroidaceae bacterium]